MLLYFFIALITISLLCCSFLCPSKKKKKDKNSFLYDLLSNGKKVIFSDDKNATYLKCINHGNPDIQYLTWRFSGNDLENNNQYILILLSYKNKQNEFELHKEDHYYLKQFYEKHDLYNSLMQDQLDEIIFVTSKYNTNKEQYLELINYDDYYIIKASLWSSKGPYAHLHIDEKNKLYFDSGIHENIAKFEFV